MFFDSLRQIVEDFPEELNVLPKYEGPSGGLTTSVLHCLHWPPDKDSLPGYGSIHQNVTNPCIRLLLKLFPEFLNHTAFDLYFKRQYLRDEDGERKSIMDIYGNDPILPHHFAFGRTMIDSVKPACETPIIILWGAHVRRFFRSVLTGDVVSIQGHDVSFM